MAEHLGYDKRTTRSVGTAATPVKGTRPSPERLALAEAKSIPRSTRGRPLSPGAHRAPKGTAARAPSNPKASKSHTPHARSEVARVGLTAQAACTPSGGCDDEHPQAHSRVWV